MVFTAVTIEIIIDNNGGSNIFWQTNSILIILGILLVKIQPKPTQKY